MPKGDRAGKVTVTRERIDYHKFTDLWQDAKDFSEVVEKFGRTAAKVKEIYAKCKKNGLDLKVLPGQTVGRIDWDALKAKVNG